MMIRPYLVLIRPANLVTAVADIVAGAAITGLSLYEWESAWFTSLMFLILSTLGLYGGGVVLNDVLDLETDRQERPERPIPSGQVSQRNGLIFVLGLYGMGVIFATLHSWQSGCIALCIVVAASAYDGWAKNYQVMGPVFMGICRGLNLLLGMSLFWDNLGNYWALALIPLVFVGAITLTSQGEVNGGNRKAIVVAMLLDATIAITLLILSWRGPMRFYILIPFLLIWWGMNIQSKVSAIRHNVSEKIMKAVKTGVISLIPLNACLAAGFGGWLIGVCILGLLPISIYLSKQFAVT